MKTLFSLLFSLASFVSFGQMSDADRWNIASVLPTYNPDYVWEKSRVVEVKKTPKNVSLMSYFVSDSLGRQIIQWAPGAPRIGDKIRVFKEGKQEIALKNESTGALMRPVPTAVPQPAMQYGDPMYGEGGAVARRTQRNAQPQDPALQRERELRKAENRARTAQVIGQVGQRVMNRGMNPNNMGYQAPPPGVESYHPGYGTLFATRGM